MTAINDWIHAEDRIIEINNELIYETEKSLYSNSDGLFIEIDFSKIEEYTENITSNKDYSKTYRLISETGMALTDGNSIFMCIDTDNIDKYHEIEYEKSIEDEYES